MTAPQKFSSEEELDTVNRRGASWHHLWGLGQVDRSNSSIALIGRRESNEKGFKKNQFRNAKKKNNNHDPTPLIRLG